MIQLLTDKGRELADALDAEGRLAELAKAERELDRANQIALVNPAAANLLRSCAASSIRLVQLRAEEIKSPMLATVAVNVWRVGTGLAPLAIEGAS